MELLIIAVAVGLGIAYFAAQNPLTVPISLAAYHLANVPLYLVVIGALLMGLLISWVISLFNALGNSFLFHKQSSRIQEDNKIIRDLKNKIRDLEIENARLKGKDARPVVVERNEYPRPSLFQRIRHAL